MPTMMNNDLHSTEAAPADRDWFGGRRWTGILSIGVLILVIVCVLVIVVGTRQGGGKHALTPFPGSPSTSSISSGVPTSALPTVVPTATPIGAVWTIYQTVALPVIPGVGPAKINGAVATGYAHTPVGALVAAANISYRYTLAPDSDWHVAAETMLAPGPGTDAWVRFRSANLQGNETPTGGTYSQIAGFQFVSYSPADAVIQVLTRDVNGTLQVGATHVTWLRDDWKLVPAASGGITATTQTVDTAAGFIEWSGV